MKLFGWKSRQYPIKRDETGQTLRQRCFRLFNQGKRPAEVSRLLPISLRTACRYFADWKKLPENFWIKHLLLRALLKNKTGLPDDIVDKLAEHFHMSRDALIRQVEKPWGIRRLLINDSPVYSTKHILSSRVASIRAALNIIYLGKHLGVAPERISAALSDLLIEAVERKKTTD